jgi:very-short-patch-repair endonuclease
MPLLSLRTFSGPAFLEGRGIKVVRVWDNEVFRNTEGVLEMIYCSLVERVEAGRDGFPPP